MFCPKCGFDLDEQGLNFCKNEVRGVSNDKHLVYVLYLQQI